MATNASGTLMDSPNAIAHELVMALGCIVLGVMIVLAGGRSLVFVANHGNRLVRAIKKEAPEPEVDERFSYEHIEEMEDARRAITHVQRRVASAHDLTALEARGPCTPTLPSASEKRLLRLARSASYQDLPDLDGF